MNLTKNTVGRIVVCGFPMVIAIWVVPAILFVHDILEEGKSFQDSFGNAFRYFDVFTLGFTVIPFFVLSIFLTGYTFLREQKAKFGKIAFLCTFGLVGILLLMVPAYYTVQSDISSTSGLVYVFLPFYCVATLVMSLIFGWVLTKLIWRKRDKSFARNSSLPQIRRGISPLSLLALVFSVLSFVLPNYLEYLFCLLAGVLATICLIKVKFSRDSVGKTFIAVIALVIVTVRIFVFISSMFFLYTT